METCFLNHIALAVTCVAADGCLVVGLPLGPRSGAAAIPQCGTSCSPFGVDRDWVAASIPAGGTTRTAEVVLMYHDFYGPSQIWVNISHDGGATFGAPQEVLTSPAVTPGAVTGTLVAQGYTFCNTVPAGVQIVRPGLPNAGRIFVAR